jgi:hypothetical protein
MNRSTRWTATVLCLLLAGAGIVACGSSDNDESDAQIDSYCENTTKIETLPEPDIDFENASPQEISTGVKAYANDKLRPLADKIGENPPDEVADDIKTLVAAVHELAETGDFESTFGDPKIDAASLRTHDFDREHCGWKRVDVMAKEYAFEGIPATLDAKVTTFEFSNKGKEEHEFVLLRKNEGVSESFDELLKLDESESRSKVTGVANTQANPGDRDYVVADLTPGDYMAICFISKGTTSDEHQGDGPPHFTMGMKHEFSVS